MPKRYQPLIDETKKFLDRNNRRNLYIEFQKSVKDSILEFAHRNFTCSYLSVVSRADIDPRNPIKTPEKIALKVYKWRTGHDPNPNARISEVHDIIGVSVVLGFPREVRLFVDLITNSNTLPFKVQKTTTKDPLNPANLGYSATHIVVKSGGAMDGLLCEIQIKTVLMEAWGKKTHDLTYKPSGELKKAHERQIAQLTQIVQLLDEQSDLVKDAIEDEHALDRSRRAIAASTYFSTIDKDALSDEFKVLLEKAEKRFRSGQGVDLEIEKKLIELSNDLIGDKGPSRDLCRIVILIALFRAKGEMNSWAMAKVDDWVESLPPEKKLNGLVFRSLANVSIGEFEEAVEDGREVLRLEIENNTSDNNIWSARMNLAYMLAEAVFNNVYVHATGGGKLDFTDNETHRKEALAIVREFMGSTAFSSATAAKIDTCAATLIQCGDSEETIKEGLALSYKAAVAGGSPPDQVVKFNDLTERRAYRRLHEFSYRQ